MYIRLLRAASLIWLMITFNGDRHGVLLDVRTNLHGYKDEIQLYMYNEIGALKYN